MFMWPTPAEYRAVRAAVAAEPEWADQIRWSQELRRPSCADDLAHELVWVVINSGMNHRVAKKISYRVGRALDGGTPVYPDAFRHRGKAAAIELIWGSRDRLFDELAGLLDAELPDWCAQLPWIGDITKWHAAKNLGADVAKPDRWLVRIADCTGETPQRLCERVAANHGDRIATVDLVLWNAAARGLIVIQDGTVRNRGVAVEA